MIFILKIHTYRLNTNVSTTHITDIFLTTQHDKNTTSHMNALFKNHKQYTQIPTYPLRFILSPPICVAYSNKALITPYDNAGTINCRNRFPTSRNSEP